MQLREIQWPRQRCSVNILGAVTEKTDRLSNKNIQIFTQSTLYNCKHLVYKQREYNAAAVALGGNSVEILH